MIALRKETTAFADFDNRQLLAVDNPNLLVFSRSDPQQSRNRVLVVVNFNDEAQTLPVDALQSQGFVQPEGLKDLCTGARVGLENEALILPALSCQWLTD
jgi:amylosucrase